MPVLPFTYVFSGGSSVPVGDEVHAVDAEVHELDRADPRAPVALDEEGRARRLVAALGERDVDQDAAPARPELVQVRPTRPPGR
jgi:hypothetical protein